MRPNRKKPESATFWFQSLSIHVARMATSYKCDSAAWRPPTSAGRPHGDLLQVRVARMAASYKCGSAAWRPPTNPCRVAA